VWPPAFSDILAQHHRMFPKLPLIVVENGCVTAADGVTREDYLARHIQQARGAIQSGIPLMAYVCWSITSNREWGLPFGGDSDFGLYHIDLDRDPLLTRTKTPAAERYRTIISERATRER
jgi:beta-glucosidase/6-phospho-beta-glucosidase/beta-galactosidase